MISAELLGVEELIRTLGLVGPTFAKRMKEGMTIASSGLRNYIANQKINGQVLQSRTGHLRQFLFWSVNDVGNDTVEGQVYETMKYGKVQEYGMTIVALRANALRWIGPDGKPRFAKSVVIPARPWMKPGYEEFKPQILATLNQASKQAAADLAARPSS